CPVHLMSSRLRTFLVAALVAGSVTLAVAPGASPVLAAIDTSDDTPWTTPTRPPRCTKAQADSGNVAGCLLAFHEDPPETGWGTPPAPGVGDGWIWNGYTYSGSPALDSWEATYIVENATTIGPVPAGRLESHVNVAPLFEGFLAEIIANGYEVNQWVTGYTFRCTGGSNVNGWKCDGDIDDLSNHAWGLAFDMNSSDNPADSVYANCTTPMVTDMPRWVVQTAEKWGLYWGGYGWNSGCTSPSDDNTNVMRDPPHFEFSGTPAQARAIALYNGAPAPGTTPRDPSLYCIDLVDAAGKTVERCTAEQRPDAGWRIPVEITAPDGAQAVVVNLTATDATVGGYLTAEDCAARPDGDRATSNTNYAPGRDAANLAIVPLVDGRICVYRSTPVHSIVDVVGYLTEEVVNEPAMWFTPSPPTRLDDTRNSGACSPTGECVTGRLPADGLLAVDLGDVPQAVANLTVVDATSPGYVAAGQCATLAAGAEFSNVNYQASVAAANLSVVSGDTSGEMCVYSHSDAHVIVDRVGTLDRHTGFGWELTPPRRVIDTRSADRVPAMGVVHIPLGVAGAGAVVNVTITGSHGPGYATIGSCSNLAPGREPTTSTVNYGRDVTVANMAFVEADGSGEACIFTYAAADVIVDVQTELVSDHELGLVTVAPSREHDSRVL
ncbi:MAG: M15 family metallopeptidase, partial [Ilumatobacteraceae bacterium]